MLSQDIAGDPRYGHDGLWIESGGQLGPTNRYIAGSYTGPRGFPVTVFTPNGRSPQRQRNQTACLVGKSIQRVLAIPAKRHQQKLVCFLTRDEIDALLSAPDNGTWFGRRDQTLLTLAVQTGLRVSELTRLVRRDIQLGTGPYVRCHGKGRKERATPLTAYTVTTLTRWLREHDCGPTDPVFPTRRGRPLSTDAVAWLLTKHAATAARRCPSLNDKHLTPHVLRHTAAMQLLHSGVDISVIALWRCLMSRCARSLVR